MQVEVEVDITLAHQDRVAQEVAVQADQVRVLPAVQELLEWV
jgi:hypothetical protein